MNRAGFAGSVRPQKSKDFAFPDLQVQRPHRSGFLSLATTAVSLPKIFRANGAHENYSLVNFSTSWLKSSSFSE